MAYMTFLQLEDPKNRLSEGPNGVLCFDGHPDDLISLIVEDAIAEAKQRDLELRVDRQW